MKTSCMKYWGLLLSVQVLFACAAGVKTPVPEGSAEVQTKVVTAQTPETVPPEPEQSVAPAATATPVSAATSETVSQAELVKQIQQSLQQLKYNPGPADGIMGPRTLAAMQQFQEKTKEAEKTEPAAEALKRLIAELASLSAASAVKTPAVGGQRLTLFAAVREAVAANLELLSKQRECEVGAQEIDRAQATRLPHLTASTRGIIIDDDRASAIFGQAERTVAGSLTFTQVLFSEQANANVTIQQQMQAGRESEVDQVKQDVALDVAVAYLNLLRANTSLKVHTDNLNVTRSNLKQANLRHSLGVSGPAEVFRWEAELAADEQAVLTAENTRRQTEMRLNRLLNRPQEESLVTVEVALSDPALITGATPFLTYLDDPAQFQRLREAAVRAGLEQAPELAQIEAAITAQRRLSTARDREAFLPTIALQGELKKAFIQEGKGSEALPSAPDDLSWSVGVQATLPLLAGGGKLAERRQARLELDRLALKRDVIAEQVEQRIRSALYQTRQSYGNIDFARDAAAAAHKTLTVVTDAYQEGATTMLELLDAQHAALVADLAVTDMVHNFLIDLLKSERAMNRLDFFLSPEEQAAFFAEL